MFSAQNGSKGSSTLKKGRRVILVDIENVAQGAVLSTRIAQYSCEMVQSVIGLSNSDQCIVGSSHISAVDSKLAWPGCRLVVRSGIDGADLALLDVLDENIADRFDEVILVSGDGIFTDKVAELSRAGVRVTVVARRRSISKRLQLAATEVLFIEDYTHQMGETA